MKTKFFAFASATVLLLTAFAGCAGTGGNFVRGEEIAYKAPENVERYTNRLTITGESENDEAGDPFVTRFNGKYYLFLGGTWQHSGVKVYESDDMLSWEYKDYVVTHITAAGAYAPEAVYYMGNFYVCQSRGSGGHYIYRAPSPTGPFELVSKTSGVDQSEDEIGYGNLSMGIDGDFFISDDGKLYLLHTTSPAGLEYNEFTDINDIRSETIGAPGQLGEANLQHWIEGPATFRRGDFTYLTYTGNHVGSRGYRVAYSYAENLVTLSDFIQPEDNVTLIDTVDEHFALGHSSNTVGPDLDSVYTAYHSQETARGGRWYNLDRYFASGGIVTANGPTHRPVAVPQGPAAGGYAEALEEQDGAYIIGSSENYFTAEYNYVPSEGQEVYFGKQGNNAYVIKTENGKVTLLRREGTKETKLGEKELAIPEGSIAVIRVENGDGVGHVYFDGMRVITYEAKAAAGAIGYKSKTGVGYTAFSNDVFGTSDFEALKNFPTKFPAVSYLKMENRGYSIAKAKQVKGGVRVGEKESTVRIGDANAVALGKEDWVKYAIDVEKDGKFSIIAEVSKASSGAEIEVTVGDKTLVSVIPDLSSAESETVRVFLGEIEAKAGIGTMKVKVLSGKADLVLFEAVARGNEAEPALLSYRVLRGNVRSEEGVLVAEGGTQDAVMLWDNTADTDFEATVTFTCEGSVTNNLGFMVRAADYSYHKDQPTQSWRGYYLQLGSVLLSLNRYDYGDCGPVFTTRTGGIDLTDGETHTLTFKAEGHRFSASLDGKVQAQGEDDCGFFGGAFGIFVKTGTIRVTSLSYTAGSAGENQ